ncbi:unnamed protein product [Pieris brassicae]|uniref:Uncharacterized protein n=1 Tax=Pieris brassicae TaxID=7116 RepID=A0A9P0TB79_PIEBR|nr:unnamed protein product [Pieris brassicae]
MNGPRKGLIYMGTAPSVPMLKKWFTSYGRTSKGRQLFIGHQKEVVLEIVTFDNRRMKVHEVAEDVGILIEWIHRISRDCLDMKRSRALQRCS